MFLKILSIILLLIISSVQSYKFMVTHKVFLDIRQSKVHLGRITIGLFGNDAPKTVENFRHLCTKGIDGKTYKGTKFHRVIERFIIQGGDIVHGDGTGSLSIYGTYFDDENLTIKHTRAGFIGMANRGTNTNGCQFYITTSRAQWLDGSHVIFGKVLEGMEVVHSIEKVKTDSDDVPFQNFKIHKCGELNVDEAFEITDELYTVWSWIQAVGPPVVWTLMVLSVFHYFFRKLSNFC